MTDARHTKLGQLANRAGVGEDIDRSARLSDELLDGGAVREGDRIDAVGAGIEVGARSTEGFVHVALPDQEDVDPRVDHQCLVFLADTAKPGRLLLDLPQRLALVVGVLQVASSGTDLAQSGDELCRLEAVARFGIDRHRHVDCAPDPRCGGEHLIGGGALMILVAKGTRDSRTGRRDDGKAGGDHGPRRGSVPRIRQHERLPGDVERPEPLAATGEIHGHYANRVAVALSKITREELKRKLDDGEEFVLVDALAPMSYAHSRLPGAVNLPPEWVDERAPSRIPSVDTEIVVYCTNATCDASVQTAQRLIELGYRNVRHYVGGKQEWESAGLPLEGGGLR